MNAPVELVDHRGAPLRRRADLEREVARPSLTGVRQAWSASAIASGLTPQRLAQLLRAAAEGDAHDYVQLAEEMEERDWHYAASLSQRKLAVLGLDRVVTAASESPQDVAIADAVRATIVEDEAFEDLLAGGLDALGKGFSAVEIAWNTKASPWRPARYDWRDPRWFRFDRETGTELRLVDEADLLNGLELPANRFVVHKPQLKMGLAVRGGLARLAAWAFLFKFYAVKDWAAFAETYGQPLRIGKYGPSATPADVDVLYRAVSMIGTDCAAVIPQSMMIEFESAPSGAGQGADLYQRLGEWLDRQVSKAVLGQDGTTSMQQGGGYAQAKVLDGVRGDILRSDARQLARTIRRDVFEPYVRFNFGPTAPVPGLQLEAPEAEDLKAWSEAIAPLVDRGLRIPARQVRDKFNIDEPAAEEEVLTASRPEPATPPADADVATAQNRSCPGCGEGSAHNRSIDDRLERLKRRRSGEPIDADSIDQLVDPLAAGWEPVMTPLAEPILRLAERCSDFASFERELAAAASEMDAGALVRALAAAAFKARGLGDASDDPNA